MAVAKAAARRGAEVTLIHGAMEVDEPMFVKNIAVASAQDMYEAVTAISAQQDIIIKAAAVADYTPETTADHKLKKSDADMSIPLKRTKDILKALGESKREGQIICGFSMETDNMLENSRKKLAAKNCDMICANSLRTQGAGFGVDTNVITMITKDDIQELPIMSKDEAAHKILDKIRGML